MYILVVSVFVSARPAVAVDTIAMIIPFVVVDEDVSVHLYHPSHQGVIVDVNTDADVLATTPVNKLKLANKDVSPRAAI